MSTQQLLAARRSAPPAKPQGDVFAAPSASMPNSPATGGSRREPHMANRRPDSPSGCGAASAPDGPIVQAAEELIAWFRAAYRDGRLPATRFRLKPGLTIVVPETFYRSLESDLAAGSNRQRWRPLLEDLQDLRQAGAAFSGESVANHPRTGKPTTQDAPGRARARSDVSQYPRNFLP